MTYQSFRTFADSWGLIAMTLIFLGFCGWTFLPGQRDANRRAANSILRDEETIDG